MKKVVLVATTLNTSQDTHNLLTSLRSIHTKGFALENVIVDNASKEPFTLDPIEKKQNIALIRSDENTGFTGGYNIGMRKALEMGADYVLVINNDTIVDPEMINELIAVLEKDEKVGMVIPKIYFAKGREFHKDRYTPRELGKVFWYAGGHVDWANVMTIHRGIDEVDHGQYDITEKVDFASGCCMMFKAEVLKKIGLFDDKFFLYYEDADMNERVKRAGYDIYYVPSAKLIHVNAASTGGAGSTLQDYFITRNQMLFGMRYATLRTKLALIRQSIRFLLNGRPMQKKGIIDFYLGRLNKGTYFNKK